MKVSLVQLTMKDKELAYKCGLARFNNVEDTRITTREQVEAYQGDTFTEADDCIDLHCIVGDGLIKVNFIEDGFRVSYIYNLDGYARVRTQVKA